MDTTKLAYVAEDLIAHKLQNGGILVAKPKFDQLGADLLGFIEVGDDAKLCRIQCKGRSLRSSRTNITIPAGYATPAFIVFLRVEADDDHEQLYCFFESDIRTWLKNGKGDYRLSLAKSTYVKALEGNRFGPDKVEKIKQIMKRSNVAVEIRQLRGFASMRFSVSGTLTDASSSISARRT